MKTKPCKHKCGGSSTCWETSVVSSTSDGKFGTMGRKIRHVGNGNDECSTIMISKKH